MCELAHTALPGDALPGATLMYQDLGKLCCHSLKQNLGKGKTGQAQTRFSLVLIHSSLKLIEMTTKAGSMWVFGSSGHKAQLGWEYPTVRSPKLADGLSTPISPTKELLFLCTMLV